MSSYIYFYFYVYASGDQKDFLDKLKVSYDEATLTKQTAYKLINKHCGGISLISIITLQKDFNCDPLKVKDLTKEQVGLQPCGYRNTFFFSACCPH